MLTVLLFLDDLFPSRNFCKNIFHFDSLFVYFFFRSEIDFNKSSYFFDRISKPLKIFFFYCYLLQPYWHGNQFCPSLFFVISFFFHIGLFFYILLVEFSIGYYIENSSTFNFMKNFNFQLDKNRNNLRDSIVNIVYESMSIVKNTLGN